MPKRNKNLKKGIPASDLTPVTPPTDLVPETPSTDLTPETPPTPSLEATFVPSADNCPEKHGFCGLCKTHQEISNLNMTSITNVGFCKSLNCKVHNNVIDLAAGADATGRAKKARKTKSSEPRPPSKVSKIVAFVSARNTFTVAEVSEISGHDLKNASVSLTILKNPVRTKVPIPFYYSAARKLWIRIGFDPSVPVQTDASAAVVDAIATPQADTASADV
jgi:hypothetical protein